jgi:hypothetical protein
VAITLMVTDGNLVPTGDPISGWTSIIATPNFNGAGTGQVTVPATPAVLEAVNATRARLRVIRNGQYFMSGPIEQNGFDWVQAGATGGGGSGDQSDPGLLTLNFTDDFAMIANELSYADPTQAATAQTLGAAYTATATNAEVVMRDLVNRNVGPGAITARKIPKLALGTLSSVGSNINLSTTFEAMGDLLRRVAIAGGGLGFRTVEDAGSIVFTVYSPRDLANQIRFSRGLSNLREIHYSPAAPTCTVAIVTGASAIRERTDSAAIDAFGRIPQLVDQTSETDTTVMDQAGDAAIAQGAATAQASFVAIDTPVQSYGVDYALGDLVTIEVQPGLQIQQIVQAVTLTADPNTGEVITPLIGSLSAITDTKTLVALQLLERQLAQLRS